MTSPLIDSLFRQTTLSPVVASAAPVRERGTRSRAGNAMSRTRGALLAGAARAVSTSGTKITMSQVATAAGVAKATLYNHFRTREAVLAALVVHQVESVVAATSGLPLTQALVGAASLIADSPVRAGLAQVEPGALAAVGRVDTDAEGWALARRAVDDALRAQGLGGGATVLRWLASFLLTPAVPVAIEADVAVLIAGLPRVAPVYPE